MKKMSNYLGDHRYMRRMMFAHFLTPSVLRDEIEEIRWRVFADDIEYVCWWVFADDIEDVCWQVFAQREAGRIKAGEMQPYYWAVFKNLSKQMLETAASKLFLTDQEINDKPAMLFSMPEIDGKPATAMPPLFRRQIKKDSRTTQRENTGSKNTTFGGIFTGGTGFNTIKAISKIRRAVDGDVVLIPGKMNLPGTTVVLPVP